MARSASPQVFLSHARRDDNWVREFVKQLTTAGIKVWWDEEEVAVGESFADKLEEGLRSSEYIVLVIDPESICSSWVNFELGAALGMGKKMIAIVAKDVNTSELPGPIRTKRYLRMESPEETARDVAEALALRRN